MQKQNKRKNNKYILMPGVNYDIYDIYDENDKYISSINSEDYKKVKKLYWVINKNGYVYNWKNKVYLHNIIMDIKEHSFNREVDHINRERTDNRRCNLRIVNRQINNFNRELNKNNSSGYKGVAWHKQRKKWRAYIMLDKKQISLGLYETKEEAYKVRLIKENEVLHTLLEEYNEAK